MEERNKKDETINSNKSSNFKSEINEFIKHIEAQADIMPLVSELLKIKMIQENKHVEKFILENKFSEIKEPEKKMDTAEDNEILKGSESKQKLLIPPDKIKEFVNLVDKVTTSHLAYNLMPINFVVSFVSQYDAYLGGLIRAMFISKPEILNTSDRNILFSDLIKFKSIDEAQEFIVDKQVESILRESHISQFKWLESKLDISLRKDLPNFNKFIEITERRNLFVHCNGIVSRQYMEICRDNNVNGIENIKLGQKLNADPEYFHECYQVMVEIGVKLGQVIWRKLIPNELSDADYQLNQVCFNLLRKGQYKLSTNLLIFATEILKKHSSNEYFCMLTINKALGYYLSNQKDLCNKVLNKHDWSATSDKFKLAIEVLNEDYKKAIKIMTTIGSTSKEISQDAYREWPLFKEFRKSDEFKIKYKEIFGEDLVYLEPKPKDLEDILTGIKMDKENLAIGKTKNKN